VLRLIKKARTKGVKIADLDSWPIRSNSITISDPTFEDKIANINAGDRVFSI